jgi:hypothetical protein
MNLNVRLIQGRESGCLHDRPPAICVGLDLTGKVGRREAADIHRLIGKTGLHFLGLQCRAQDAAECLDGPAGSPHGNKNAEPFGEFERRVSRLGNGWHIGQQRAALCARRCQRPQRPGRTCGTKEPIGEMQEAI